ncbi:MAG TPA: hypothetical protein VFL83_01760 [Anaeromyxobacter sp.]|nr:hypothetical protein [Anaeromyxobacter sp.]
MPPPQLSSLRAGTHPGALLAAVAAAALAVALSTPRLAQDPAYHAFADRRALAGVPNAADVLSNLAFAAAGLAGLRAVRRHRFLDSRERAPWTALFGGALAIAAASSVYHLAPANGTLALDRLAMTVGFMGLLAAMIAERVDARAGARLLAPLLALGASSVVWWWASELRGAGDLRPYYFVQTFSLAAVPLLVAAGAPRYTGARWLLAALAVYGVAKLAEAGDRTIFAATGGIVSGHTLKHLLAAAAIALVAVMLDRRRPAATARTT